MLFKPPTLFRKCGRRPTWHGGEESLFSQLFTWGRGCLAGRLLLDLEAIGATSHVLLPRKVWASDVGRDLVFMIVT